MQVRDLLTLQVDSLQEHVAPDLYDEAIEEQARLNEKIASLSDQLAEISAWKKSAMSVMAPYQDIAHALEIPLGATIHDNVLPHIIKLKCQLVEAKEREAVDAARIHLFDEEVGGLHKQLAEARAENERLNELLDEATHDYFCDMNRRLAEARQEAARECADEAIKWIDHSAVKSFRRIINLKFKLEDACSDGAQNRSIKE